MTPYPKHVIARYEAISLGRAALQVFLYSIEIASYLAMTPFRMLMNILCELLYQKPLKTVKPPDGQEAFTNQL